MGGGSQTSSTNQSGTQNYLNAFGNSSGSTLNGNELATLNQVAAFDTSQMQNGISPANAQQAMQNNQTQDQQSINNILHTLGPSSANSSGLATELGQQATMGNAQTAANIAADSQTLQMQGANALQGNTQIANPVTNWNNGQSGGSQQSTGNSTTTNTSSPSFGSFLGSLLGMAGGAMTGGAAGAGGVGNILMGL